MVDGGVARAVFEKGYGCGLASTAQEEKRRTVVWRRENIIIMDR
jgi:hypothetical protein